MNLKKFLSLFSCTVLVLFSAISAGAESQNANQSNSVIVSESIEYYPDGSSAIITVSESVDLVSSYAAAYAKSGTKTYRMRNKDGEILWKFIVSGTFTVNPGVSATCTKTSYSKSDLASGWDLKSGSSYASGNQAIGDGTFQHKTLFIVTDTKSCHVVLSCDKNGNLS